MSSLDAFPMLPGGTVTGHLQLFQKERLPFLLDAMGRGDVTRLRFLHKTPLVVSGARAAHEVLVEKARSFEKSPGLRLLLYYLAGDGLFTSEGELWKRQRRLMAPLFQPAQIERYAAVMRHVTLRAVGRLRDGERVDLARETTRIAMGVVGVGPLRQRHLRRGRRARRRAHRGAPVDRRQRRPPSPSSPT